MSYRWAPVCTPLDFVRAALNREGRRGGVCECLLMVCGLGDTRIPSRRVSMVASGAEYFPMIDILVTALYGSAILLAAAILLIRPWVDDYADVED